MNTQPTIPRDYARRARGSDLFARASSLETYVRFLALVLIATDLILLAQLLGGAA